MTATETILTAAGPQGLLEGTLLSPEAPGAPVVLMIPGSGPTDRDGNSSIGGVRPASLKLLAEALAARGIASVRIDKRGLFGSKAAIADPNHVTIDDYALDVHSWATAIAAKTGARGIWVLGHSEGGLVALTAGQLPAGLCGLILVAAAGRPLGAILREQLAGNPANTPVLDQAMAALESLEAGRHADVSGMHPALLPLFGPAVQDFLINQMAKDPAQLIAATTLPVLIIQPARDIQVSLADAARLHAAAPAAQLYIVPDANHVLKSVTSDDRNANIATYASPDSPLAPGIAEVIADFVATTGS